MANMSYCRFENTLPDLEDCADHLWDELTSREEWNARKRLAEVAAQIAEDWEELKEDYGGEFEEEEE